VCTPLGENWDFSFNFVVVGGDGASAHECECIEEIDSQADVVCSEAVPEVALPSGLSYSR